MTNKAFDFGESEEEQKKDGYEEFVENNLSPEVKKKEDIVKKEKKDKAMIHIRKASEPVDKLEKLHKAWAEEYLSLCRTKSHYLKEKITMEYIIETAKLMGAIEGYSLSLATHIDTHFIKRNKE